jgi:hypothetical protein
MLRPAAPVIALAMCFLAFLLSSGANASRPDVPDVVNVSTGSFSAVVKWHVDDSARVVVQVGTDERYGIWSPTTITRGADTEKTTLTGLEPATTYRYSVVARWRNGFRAETKGSFRTDAWPGSLSASATPSADATTSTSDPLSPWVITPTPPPGVNPGSGGSPPSSSIPAAASPLGSSAPLRVNGVPIFPRMVWRQCPTYYPTSIAAGINVFLGSSCDGPDAQFAKLAGRAASTVDASTPGVSGPGLIGWHLPDEADVSVGDASKLPEPSAGGRVTFLTLTDHFSSNAAPPPNGKSIYPDFIAKADVIGFDTYPLEVRCTISQIDNVYWMQRELVGLAKGKPTFQWIEAGPMEHCPGVNPTPTDVRAETWLAIAGGARGIGYFPDYWSDDIRASVASTNREITALAPALLDQVVNATWSAQTPVRVGVRRHNGAVYVIAVNTSTSPAPVSFTVPGLAGRPLHVFSDGRTIRPFGDLAVDKLPGLGVAVYVAAPAGW